MMQPLLDKASGLSRERLAELISAASYGSVLVLAGLSVIGVSDVAKRHGVELVAGVGLATWIAHLFAELLGEHIRHAEPLDRREVKRAAVDGSPILASTVLPALVLGLGRLDVISPNTARIAAIVTAVLQLMGIGGLVARVVPAPPTTPITFALITATAGLAVVMVTVLLGH
jgi:hypothetical protein